MKSLQELATEYSQNIIDHKTYRDARSALIQAICAHEVEVIDKTYLPPLDILATPNPPAQKSNGYLSGNSATGNGKNPVQRAFLNNTKKHYILLLCIAIFLCIIILIASLISIPESNQKTQATIAMPNAPKQEVLISQFLPQKNRQTPHKDVFIASWMNTLTEEGMLVASTSTE